VRGVGFGARGAGGDLGRGHDCRGGDRGGASALEDDDDAVGGIPHGVRRRLRELNDESRDTFPELAAADIP
jgi:hypothetical protein